MKKQVTRAIAIGMIIIMTGASAALVNGCGEPVRENEPSIETSTETYDILKNRQDAINEIRKHLSENKMPD